MTLADDKVAPVKLSVRKLYKVFGASAESMIPHVQAGMGKEELLSEHGHVLGLNDINVDMQKGKITVIMGLSGSGKSTLIRHLNRLIEPTSGKILLDGKDITSLPPDELQKLRQNNMSMVFQKFALLPHRTVLENAATAKLVRGEPQQAAFESARRWLDRVGLSGYEDRYPNHLSGGMQQRVGIARALCAETDIMLLDEAFSALDPIIRTDMQSLLIELQDELHKTIVFITHDLDEALRLADHLVILQDGRIVQQGEPQQIVLNPADEYIDNFVRDINRARVLRVASVMQERQDQGDLDCEVNASDTLESVIAKADGQIDRSFTVVSDGAIVGWINMHIVLSALVPTKIDKQPANPAPMTSKLPETGSSYRRNDGDRTSV